MAATALSLCRLPLSSYAIVDSRDNVSWARAALLTWSKQRSKRSHTCNRM